MKRILVFALAAAVIMGCSAYAACCSGKSELHLNTPGKVDVCVKPNTEVKVSIDICPHTKVNAAQVLVGFDSTMLTPVDITAYGVPWDEVFYSVFDTATTPARLNALIGMTVKGAEGSDECMTMALITFRTTATQGCTTVVFLPDESAIAGTYLSDMNQNLIQRPGTLATFNSQNICIDATPPNCNVSVNPASWTAGNTVTVTVCSTDNICGVAKCEISIDGGSWVTLTGTPPCYTYNIDVSAMPDGVHSIAARCTDKAGNVSNSADCTKSFFLDKTRPTCSIVVDPNKCTKENVVWCQFAGFDNMSNDLVYTLSIDDGTEFTPSANPYAIDTTAMADGKHKVCVKVVDEAGNNRTCCDNFFIDRTKPVIDSFVIAPDGCTKANSLTLTFTGSDTPVIDNCGLDRWCLTVDGNPCRCDVASPFVLDVSNLADGEHTFCLTLWDKAGNESDVECLKVKIDRTPPKKFYAHADPATCTNANTIVVSFCATDVTCGVAFYQIKLDNEAWRLPQIAPIPCPDYLLDVTSVPDGDHVILVRAVDWAGNEQISEPLHIYLDKTPPEPFAVTINPTICTNSGILACYPTTDAGASFGCGIDHYEVKVNDEPFINVDAMTCIFVSTKLMPDSCDHTITVKAVDKAGNFRIAPPAKFSVDNSAPVIVSLKASPAVCTNNNNVTITWNVTDQPACCGPLTYCLRVDNLEWRCPVTSPYTLDVSGLCDGPHSVCLQATDVAGNKSEACVTICLDKSDPHDCWIEAGPPAWTNQNSIIVSFGATDIALPPPCDCGIDNYKLRVDGGTWSAPVTSPYTLDLTGLADGKHTVCMKATDKAGNSCTVCTDIFIDKVPPVITNLVADPPTCTNAKTIRVTFSANDAMADYIAFCIKFGSGSYVCGVHSPYDVDVTSVPDGDYDICVKAIDIAGNFSEKCITVSLDKTPPEIGPITFDPPVCTNAKSICATWSVTDNKCGVDHSEVVIDALAPITVTSPYCFSTQDLASGEHTFCVTAYDKAGNKATRCGTFKLDKDPPIVTFMEVWQSGRQIYPPPDSGIEVVPEEELIIKVKVSDSRPTDCGLPDCPASCPPCIRLVFREGADPCIPLVDCTVLDPSGVYNTICVYKGMVDACWGKGLADLTVCAKDIAGNEACATITLLFNPCMIKGTIEVPGLKPPSGGLTWTATFVETRELDPLSLKTWTVNITFPENATTANYVLKNAIGTGTHLSADFPATLRDKKVIAWGPCCQGIANFSCLPGDSNRDNCINVLDYSCVRANWFKVGLGLACDFNGDGTINLWDLLLLKTYWYQCGKPE